MGFSQKPSYRASGRCSIHNLDTSDNVLTLDPVAINAGTANLTPGSLCYSTNAGGAGIGGMLYSNGSTWQKMGGLNAVGAGWIPQVPGGLGVANLGSAWKVAILMGSAYDGFTGPIGGFIYNDGTGFKARLYYFGASTAFNLTTAYQGWTGTPSGGRRDFAVLQTASGDIFVSMGDYGSGVSYLLLN
jgi:hypothetical protein